MSAIKVKKCSLKNKRVISGKQKTMHNIDKRPLPPPFEAICDIPVMDGNFLETFFRLKATAFNILMQNYPSNSRTSYSPKVAPYMGGFSAFKRYYSHEFYGIPCDKGMRLFSMAWEACDHKHVWEYYALQYTKYRRKEGFIEWLLSCKKSGSHADLLIVDS